MDPTLKVAIAGAIGLVVGALITAIVAPHINWGIEKRKILHVKKQALINDWRALVKKVRYEFLRGSPPGTVLDLIEDQGAFAAFRPHLSKDTLEALKTRDVKGTSQLLYDEITRIEKEWDLL